MSKLKRRLHLLAALLSLGAAFAILVRVGLPERADYSGYRIDGGRAVAPEAGSSAPPFTLTSSRLQTLTLEEARGSVTIINFWATWCPPCRREMRELQKLYEMDPADLRILAVNVGESVQAVQDWVAQHDLSFDVLLDRRGDASRRYHLRGLPTTFVLDADHLIQRVYYGPLRLESLRRDLARVGRKV